MLRKIWLNTLLFGALLASSLNIAQAAPVWQGTNLLVNGGFETGGGSTGAASWLPWWSEQAKPADGSFNYAFKPSWNVESLANGANSTFIYSGSNTQRIVNNWDPWFAGVKQVVSVPAGTRVRLTVTAKVRAGAQFNVSPNSDPTAAVRVSVGLDPAGSDNQFASNVVWSGGISPHNTWQSVSVEAVVGAGGKVGVFLAADYRGASREFLEAYFDETSLVAVGQQAVPTNPPGGATSAPQPTAAPVALTPFTIPTPGADGNIIYVVQEGDSLWRVAGLANVTVDQVKTWNALTNDIISVGQRLIIGQGTPSIPPTATAAPTVEAASPTPGSAEPTQSTQPPAGATEAPASAVGTACAIMYEDVNGNTRRDADENLVAGGQFTVVNKATGAPVAAYTTDGVNEPYCAENLPAGTFTFSSAAPQGYNATTANSAQLQVEAGSLSNIEFGVQRSANAPQATPAASGGANARLRTAMFGAAGVIFLLLAAGFAGFLFLRRPR